MTNEEHAVITARFVEKARLCQPDLDRVADDVLTSIVGTVVADMSLIADGVLSVDAVRGWYQ